MESQNIIELFFKNIKENGLQFKKNIVFGFFEVIWTELRKNHGTILIPLIFVMNYSRFLKYYFYFSLHLYFKYRVLHLK